MIFFAGVFGPLMLFWLILGYIQQQNELQQNTRALELQAEELKNSVDQHKELVKATQEQAKAELRSIEIEQEKSRKENLPDFSLKWAKMIDRFDGNLIFEYRFINSGKPAKEVSVISDPVLEEIRSAPVIAYLNADREFGVRSTTSVSGKLPEKLKLTLKCESTNGNPYERSFYLKMAADKRNYRLTSVGEVC
ncbi:hypothetical protein ACJJI4_08305 [Microbulbifer sp. TRSA002]|uniref:hypothetical protein n=1 Tax=Microbulbifer sp. TRSA002 TaxID=3243382 RepID=UPI0040399DE1